MSTMSSLPALADFFPPTPRAFNILSTGFKCIPLISLLQWTPIGNFQFMGKTSTNSPFNLNGRFAWSIAEVVGPANLLFIIYTLPSKLRHPSISSSSILGTGLPVQNEMLAMLYVLHYLNRAVVTPLFRAPSMSPIHVVISVFMAIFQYVNSSCIGSWIVYSTLDQSISSTVLSVLGLGLFSLGLVGNITSEGALFSLRRGAAKRKAKSESKATVKYDKVYAIPPAEGLFKYILYPHYVFEWLEWTGYWLLGAGLGLGWSTPALWFVINELVTMAPRAVQGRRWYEKKFGKRAVGGRGGFTPTEWL